MKRIVTLLSMIPLVLSTFAQAPNNDACIDAALLAPVATGTCGSGSVQGTTEAATSVAPAPTCDGTGVIQDVWYRFNTAGFTGNFILDITGGTAVHWAVQLFLGGCDGVLVGCYGNSPTSTVLPSLVADQNYTIRVFTNTDIGAAGSFSICLSAQELVSDCGTTIYDQGGATGNYESNIFPYQNVNTYCPASAAQGINMTFTAFHTRNEDIVRIYDGPDINSPLLGTFSGNLNSNLPGPFQSTHPTGCLTLRFNYNSFFSTQSGWAANLNCCTQPVLQVSPTSNSPVCTGGTLILDPGPTAGTSFNWSGPNGFTSTEQFPEIPNFDIANVGAYSVSTSAGTAGCTSNSVSTMVLEAVPPTALSASASSNLLCGPGSVDLSAQAVTAIQAVQQGFETFPATGWGTTGSGVSAATNTQYYAEGTRSVLVSYSADANGHYGMTSDINLATTPNAVLTFKHICALEQGWDYGFVEYSLNGGGSWAALPASSYLGSNNSNFTGGNVRFSRNSASAWQSQFSSASSDPGAGPATALWQLETFDLAQFAASTSFRLRFRISADGSVNYYGWLIDDVQLNGGGIADYTWSSSPAGFTSNVQNPTAVPISTTTTFTVTASTGAGAACSLSETVTVEMQGSVPSIDGPAAITRCTGVPFNLNSSLTGGAAPFTYVWTSNGTVLGAGANLIGLILTENSNVTLTVTDASGCQNSASVQVTVAPPPSVSLASFSSVCVNWAPFALTGGLPAGGSYKVNGTPTTHFDPAMGVGVYIVLYEYTDANGCIGSAQRTIMVDACTSIDEMQAVGLSVYPNPASDLLYVTANAGKYNIELLDAAGRLVLRSDLDVSNDRERQIQLDACVNGMYSVVIIAEDGQRYTKRLVIAR